MRRKDVASTSFRRHVPTSFFNKSVPYNCISHLEILHYTKFKDRIERNSLPVPSNQIKITFIIILPFSLVHLCFFQFLIEIEGQCGWIIRGGRRGGAKGMLAPLSNYLGGLPPPPPPPSLLPPPPPSSYAFAYRNLQRM